MSPESHDELIARLKAQMDQAAAGMVELARVLGEYRDALIEQGFTRQEVLVLVVAWQQQMLGGGSATSDPA